MDEREFEIASNTTERLHAEGVAMVQLRLAPQHHPDFDGAHCLDCETPLPALRLEMGRIRCVECQTSLDARLKRRLA